MSEQPSPPSGINPKFNLGERIQADMPSPDEIDTESVAAAKREIARREVEKQQITDSAKLEIERREIEKQRLADKEQESRYAATHDELTGLPNRRYLMERLDELVTKSPGKFAALFLDIDGLKKMNDTDGHEAGDQLIIHTGEIANNSIRHRESSEIDGRPPDVAGRLVARLGGDEFVILLPDVHSQDSSDIVRERIQGNLEAEGIHASFGGRVHNSSETPQEFLNAIDQLMYEEKQSRTSRG